MNEQRRPELVLDGPPLEPIVSWKGLRFNEDIPQQRARFKSLSTAFWRFPRKP